MVGGVVNFCSDKYWSFSARSRVRPRHAVGRSRSSRRLLRLLLGSVLAGLSAVLFTDVFILAVSAFMILVAATTLTFQLYKWWRPEHNDPHRYGEPDAPRLPGVILVPMRHEEAVAGQTLERLARLDHPDYWVVPIIDHPDDPGTAAIAHDKAREHPGKVLVCPYPEETDVHNKPIGLNAAVEMLHELQIPFAWVGVADAEDLFHPDLLKLVDYRFRTTGAGIVQCGVQLMNFASDPHTLPLPSGRLARAAPVVEGPRQRLVAGRQRAGVLQVVPVPPQAPGGGQGHAAGRQHGVLPPRVPRGPPPAARQLLGRGLPDRGLQDRHPRLGPGLQGRRRLHRGAGDQGGDPGHPGRPRPAAGAVDAGLHPRLRRGRLAAAAPPSASGCWPSMCSGSSSSRPPPGCWRRSRWPWPCSTRRRSCSRCWRRCRSPSAGSPSLLDVVLLAQFGQTFGERVRLRDYAGLVLGAYPFQVVLSVAAVWATARFALGRNDWVKTRHDGVHLGATAARSPAAGVGGEGLDDLGRPSRPHRHPRRALAPPPAAHHGGGVVPAPRGQRLPAGPAAGPGRRGPRHRDVDLPPMGRRPRDLPVAGLVLPVPARPVALLLHLRPRAGGLDPDLAVVDAHQRLQPARLGDRLRQRVHADRQAGQLRAAVRTGPPPPVQPARAPPGPCCCSGSARSS